MHSLGLDIGSYSIKLAEVVQKGRVYELLRVDEHPLSQDPNQDRTLEIIEYLKQLPPSKARLVIGLPGNELCWRAVFFPFTQRHKIMKSLAFELEDRVPLQMDSSVVEAYISRQVLGGCEVLGLMAPQESIQKHLSQVTDAGLQAYALSAKPLALANIFQPWQDEVPLFDSTKITTDVEVIVELGHRVSNLILLARGAVLDFRSITWGGHNVIEQVAKKYSLHYKEAHAKIQSEGQIVITPDESSREALALSEVIKRSIADFAYRLNLILVELKSSYKLQCKNIILCGGLAQIKNLAPFMTQSMNLNTNVLKKLPRHPELDLQAQGAALTAIGLALEGIKKPKNPPLNFLKGKFQQSSNTVALFLSKWKYSMAVGTALYAACFMWAVARQQLSSSNSDTTYTSLKQISTKVTGLTRRQNTARNIKKFIKTSQQKAQLHQELEKIKSIPSALDWLNKISQAAPSQQQIKLNIQQLSILKGRVRLQAQSENPQSAQNFVKSLARLATNKLAPAQGTRVNLNFELKK